MSLLRAERRTGANAHSMAAAPAKRPVHHSAGDGLAVPRARRHFFPRFFHHHPVVRGPPTPNAGSLCARDTAGLAHPPSRWVRVRSCNTGSSVGAVQVPRGPLINGPVCVGSARLGAGPGPWRAQAIYYQYFIAGKEKGSQSTEAISD
jgi:hypothetical protein